MITRVEILMTENVNQLAARLGGMLASKKWQISCAESCTGGGLGYAITNTPGSSAWFEKGFITYSNQAKQDLLAVSQETLFKHGAVSAQTVEEMALGAAKAAEAEVAISISGVAGPDGGTAKKPVGTVWFGFVIAGEVVTQKQQFDGDRQAVRIQAVEFALSHILKLMTK